MGRELLMSADVRLVSLIGPPGVGKSSLAITLVRSLAGEFAAGVVFVDLANVLDAEGIERAVAEGMRLRGSAEPLGRRIAEAVGDESVLLVLDGFDHLIEAAPLVGELLDACAVLKVLATSRERLAISGEHELTVAPLPTPDERRAARLSVVERSPAVELFVERAQSVSPSFVLNDQNAATVARICQRLDGLPLAIELAAAQCQSREVAEILDQLSAERRDSAGHDPVLELLAARGGEDPIRQRALRHAIELSYRLLHPAAQALLQHLAVFVGGCTVDSARAVCAAEMPDIEALAEKNLIRRERSVDGTTRLRLLEPIRHFASELLSAEELEALAQRHALHYLELAESAEPGLAGAGRERVLTMLEWEHENLRAAQRWAITADLDAAARLASALWRFWALAGYAAEGAAYLDRVLLRSHMLQTQVRANALHAAARLDRDRGRYAQALERCHGALALYEAEADLPGIALALNTLANITGDVGHHAAARELYSKSLEIRRQLGDTSGEALALHNIASLDRDDGRLESAWELCERSHGLFQQAGDRWGVAISLLNLGHTAYLSGRHAEAHRLVVESLRTRREVQVRQGMLGCVDVLAYVALATGEPSRAVRWFGATEAIRELLGVVRPPDERPEIERDIQRARALLGDVEFEAAWALGRSLDLDDVVDEALASVAVSAPESPAIEPESVPVGRPVRSEAWPPVSMLTRREREVATLLARGLTNRQIGEELVITEGSAANNVRRVMQRLGVRNRAQIAAWAVEHGLNDGSTA
jgi:predicted ATPase/DNA-binding CsgD family transcriptional regulator